MSSYADLLRGKILNGLSEISLSRLLLIFADCDYLRGKPKMMFLDTARHPKSSSVTCDLNVNPNDDETIASSHNYQVQAHKMIRNAMEEILKYVFCNQRNYQFVYTNTHLFEESANETRPGYLIRKIFGDVWWKLFQTYPALPMNIKGVEVIDCMDAVVDFQANG